MPEAIKFCKSFPYIETELAAQGALKIDWVREFHHFGEAGWSANAQSPSDVVSFTCSRPLLEWTIRSQLKRFANVHFIEEQRVTQLLYNADIEKYHRGIAAPVRSYRLNQRLKMLNRDRRLLLTEPPLIDIITRKFGSLTV